MGLSKWIAPLLFCSSLLPKDEVDGQDKTCKTCQMVPLEWVALDKQDSKEREYHKRDNLLDNLELPECEWAAELLAAKTVGRNLEAVLKESDTPADEYDGNHAIALKL